MIVTLKNLHEASAQQVFDQVATHLLTQKEASIDHVGGGCYYRYEGLKCAAGCLIADDEYDDEMDNNLDGSSWLQLVNAGMVGTRNHLDLIMELQALHDEYKVSEWNNGLKEIAALNNLEFKH